MAAEFCCLRLATGQQVWEDKTAGPEERWATIHLIRNSDRTWMLNERGELIIARLTPGGFQELSRAKLLAPTTDQLRRRDGVTWLHPAFAYRHVFARNDRELVSRRSVGAVEHGTSRMTAWTRSGSSLEPPHRAGTLPVGLASIPRSTAGPLPTLSQRARELWRK